MAGTFPSTPAIAGLKITSYQPTFVSVSHNLMRQARSRGGAQRWAMEATYPPNLTRAELAPLLAFCLMQRGQYEIFTFVPPALWATARGVATGTPLVNGAGQTGRTINTKGWTISQSNIMRAGDFIKFAGHEKVYMVMTDANSDGSGNAALAIEPALMASPANNAVVTVNNVPFSVALASDTLTSDIEAPNKHSFSVSLIEVF